MGDYLDLSPAQRFRVRCALAPEGMSIDVTRKEALELARAWEAAERSSEAEAAYHDLYEKLRTSHADILEKSAELLAASERLRRRFWFAMFACALWGFFTGFAFGAMLERAYG